MPEWTEEDMPLALEVHASGVSQNKAADTYGINRTAFKGHFKGSTASEVAHRPRQKLSEYQGKSPPRVDHHPR
ncbi:hypothetical protein BFJ71_g16921 [Fusarium oxysporum]|nr:hypothetical protein BFJ71_g16921 [Fusarium oxysporum]